MKSVARKMTYDEYCQGKGGLDLLRRFSSEESFESRLLAGFRMSVNRIFQGPDGLARQSSLLPDSNHRHHASGVAVVTAV